MTLFFANAVDAENKAGQLSSRLIKESVMDAMVQVADWQLENPSDKELWVWEYGAFYSGLMDFYRVNKDEKYLKAMIDMGKEYDWSIRPMPYNANVLAIAHMYVDLYEILQDPKIIDKTRYCLDIHFDRKPKEPDVRFTGNDYWLNWWSWCDALFMAPPAFAKFSKVTGEQKYLEKMDQLWRVTYDYLYDKEEKLYYRDDRFFTQKSANGKKLFWSRGNGWVIAGLVKVLQSMPDTFANAQFYKNHFMEMAEKIKSIQTKNGHWPTSLLDEENYGGIETSGTGFFCYALAWGVNNGYLDEKEYLPVVKKAWNVLVESVHSDGMLGYVQKVAHEPENVAWDDTEVYGVGAFLMAGSEVYELSK